jgi:hypothetical protein
MKIFYDTEFIEDGRTIDLISIGMVAEDGRELYLVNDEIDDDPLSERIRGHNWLMENVIPHLPLKTRHDGRPSVDMPGSPNVFPRKLGHFGLDLSDNRIVPRRFIRNSVRDFIQATPDAELWAWYGAYDHVVLAQLFGRMIDLPEGVPMWTNDLKQEVVRLGNPHLTKQETGDHNALADARWVKAAYESLHGDVR